MRNESASNYAAAASSAGTCQRCGDYSALKPFGSRRLCTTCLERVSFARSGLSMGTVLRETLWVTKQLVPAIGVYWLFQIVSSSLAIAMSAGLFAFPGELMSRAVKAIGGILETFFWLLALGFAAALTSRMLAQAQRPTSSALGSTLRSWQPLSLLALIMESPAVVTDLLGVRPSGELHITTMAVRLISVVAFYAPALIVDERMSVLNALRASIAFVRGSRWLLLMCSLVLRLPLTIMHAPLAKMLRVWLHLLMPQPWNQVLGIAAASVVLFPLLLPHTVLRSVLLFKLRVPR